MNTSLESLIKTVNRLQDAFSSVGTANPLDLPQITVIGSQSSGKSSVLENIVGKDFLPRGSGIVTRRPLVLQLVHRPATDGSSSSSPNSANEPTEWAEFLHRPGEKFTNFHKVRDEIVADTDKITGKNAGISNKPISLKVYSPNVLTLTLVDLPGLTKVPVGDQPADIERQIREMISKYITKPNAIILAVTAANTDLANSDGLKLAREVDPEGLRTLGVLTKIDLMDPGTDVVDILAGRIIPLRLGYVPVVNRGQRDIEQGKEITKALDKEREFFENHSSYRTKAAYCGTPFLAKKLSMLLMHHIRNTLPEIKNKISMDLQKYTQELMQLGEDFSGSAADADLAPMNMLLKIITDFSGDFRTAVDGTGGDLSTQELSGGARISYVFHECFASGIRGVEVLDTVKDVDIRTIMYNSSGSAPSLFVGTTAFEVIIKQQIRKLEDPSLKCVTMVFDELVRIINTLLSKPVFVRYPVLKERFFIVVSGFMRKLVTPTNKLVSDMIAAEACYVNTAHPDFISGHRAVAMVQERMNNLNGPQTGSNSSNINNGPMTPPRVTPQSGLTGLTGGGGIGATARPGFGSTLSSALGSRPGTSHANHTESNEDAYLRRSSSGAGLLGGRGGGNAVVNSNNAPPSRSFGGGILEPVPAVLRASGTLSEREMTETEVIKLLLQSYFSIVKRTVSDMVPKAAMLHLVNYAKDHLQRELLTEVYGRAQRDSQLASTNKAMSKDSAGGGSDLVVGNGGAGGEWESFSADNLLREADGIVDRRKECRRMIEALQKAEAIVGAV